MKNTTNSDPSTGSEILHNFHKKLNIATMNLSSNIQLLVWIAVLGSALLSSENLMAQTEDAATDTDPLANFALSGTVDAYFRSNLNGTNTPGEGTMAPATSFANLPGFSLGMANLIASYEGSKVGFTADLVFGPRGDEAVFASVNGSGDPSNSALINQLYVFWNISDKLTFTFGNFNTFLGYEVISPAGNFNYSTSYMFSYGPFSHTGLKADVDLGSGFSLMAGIFNPTDATDFNPTGKYAGGFQLGYENDNGGAWLNFLIDEDYFQVDLTTGWDVSDNIYLGLNATSSDLFWGTAGYVQVSTSETFALGLRAEYFTDQELALFETEEETSIVDFTLSANYTIGNLTLIPEIRLDAFDQDFVITGPAERARSLTSFLLAAVYSF